MRSSYVYEDLMAFDLNDSKNSRILTEKEIIGEDYHRLVDFLENEVLPKNIEYRKDNDNYITCITYSSLLKYNFSLEELKFIIKYLKSKNIEIRTILYNSYFIRDFKISTKYTDFIPVFSELKKLKTLDNDYQRELLIKYHETKDIEIKKKLVEGNMPLLFNTLNKLNILKRRNDFYDDIFSEACLGLMKAIEDYDIDSSYQFSTIAVKYIIDSILNYLRKNRAITPLYGNFLVAKSVIEEKFGITLEHDFSIFDYILDYMVENNQIRNCDRALVTRRLIWFLKKIYPYYKEIGEGINDRELDYNIINKEIKEVIDDGVESLRPDIRDTFKLRYGIDSEQLSTLEVAKKLGISEGTVMARIRNYLPLLREYYCKNTGDSCKVKTK